MHIQLINKKPEAGDAVTFQFSPDEPTTWLAGQYMVIILPHKNPDERGIERYFTISAAPYEGHLQITTRITSSSFKQTLNNLPLGSTMEVRKVSGSFTLPEPTGSYAFLAGGIGITPFRSILLDLVHRDLTDTPITLLYANRSEEIVFRDELEHLTARLPNLKVHYLVDPERLDSASIQTRVPDLHEVIFYLSGPEPMIQSLKQTLLDLSVEEEHIKTDEFPGYTSI